MRASANEKAGDSFVAIAHKLIDAGPPLHGFALSHTVEILGKTGAVYGLQQVVDGIQLKGLHGMLI